MNKRTRIADLLKSEGSNYEVTVKGWIRTFRNDRFIALSDGSTLNTLQIVVNEDIATPELLKKTHYWRCYWCIRRSSTLTR